MYKKDDCPYIEMTEEQRKEWHSKGGKASAIAKKRKADLRQAAINILSGPISEPALKNMLKLYGIADGSNADAVVLAQLQKAVNGDTTAAIYLRDTSGQSPTAKAELSIDRPTAGADLRLLSDTDLQKLIDNEE